MPTLNTTPNRAYQEPFGANDLMVDVGRIISALRAIDVDVADAFAQIIDLAPKTSPAFSGTPTAPTPVAGTDSNQLATTAFVAAALAALVDSSPEALNTLNELAAALGDDPNFATTITNLIATKADGAATTAALALKANVADIPNIAWERIGGIRSLSGQTAIVWADLSTYRMLRLRVDGTPATGTGSAFLRVSQDNGATWNTGASDYTYGSLQSVGTSTVSNAYSSSSFLGMSSNLDSNICILKGETSNFNVALSSLFQCDCAYQASGVYNRIFPTGYRSASVAHNALQFSTTNGLAWVNGTAVLEGIRG